MRMGTVGLWVPNRGDAELDGLTVWPSVVILLRLQMRTEKRQRVDEACAHPLSSSLSPTNVAQLCRCAPMSPCGRAGLQHPPLPLAGGACPCLLPADPKARTRHAKKFGLVWTEAQLLKQRAKFKAVIPVISAKCHSEFPGVAVCPVQVSPCNGTFPYYSNAPSWIFLLASPSLSTFPPYSKGFSAQGDPLLFRSSHNSDPGNFP